MSRIQLINGAATTGDRAALLDQIHGAFGVTDFPAVPLRSRA